MQSGLSCYDFFQAAIKKATSLDLSNNQLIFLTVTAYFVEIAIVFTELFSSGMILLIFAALFLFSDSSDRVRLKQKYASRTT